MAQFGEQAGVSEAQLEDVTAAMHEPTIGHEMLDDVFEPGPDRGDA